MRKRLFFVFLCCCTLFSFTHCSYDEIYNITPPIPSKPEQTDTDLLHKKTNRTVLAYVVADMNLWFQLEKDINEMEKSWDEETDGTLLVYLDKSGHLTQFDHPVLLKVRHDETDRIVSEVIKDYPNQDAGSADVIHTVLNDAATLYPADSHGLIIAAHGDAWLPDMANYPSSRALSGSERYGSSLEIEVLAKALPRKYDFIIFHACLMSNVETAYQLRNKCDYLMAPVTNLPGDGYPYDKIIPFLYTKPKADLYHASLLSFEDYQAKYEVKEGEFTVQVIRTSELENLAAATSKLLDNLKMSYEEIRYGLYMPRPELDNDPIPDEHKNYVIDYMDGILIDLKGLAFLTPDNEVSDSFVNALNKAVVQNFATGSTPNMWKMTKTNAASGLSFYLPYPASTPYVKQLNEIFRKKYDWAKASGFDKER